MIDLGIPGISDAVQVGQGGFGVVYRARQAAVGRTVAVKVLNVPALGDEGRRRFERECQALGAVSGHPNIVAVFDSGISGEQRPYLVMDYLPGGTLGERLERDGPVSWQIAADVGVKLAGALGAAHEAGVLHRDVKPDNVLVSAYGEPQLVDFGIARLLGGSQSRVGEISATLAHAAPEVLVGDPATQASDVYSLASTLYELLSGSAPFVRPTDETFHPLLERVRSAAPPDLREGGLPEAMWEPISAGLVKDPSQRIPTARALAEALQQAQRTLGVEVTPLVLPVAAEPLAGQPAVAPADTVLGLRRRRTATVAPAAPAGSARRRWLLVAAGLISALLLAGAGAAMLLDDGDNPASETLAATQSAPTTETVSDATATAPASGATSSPNAGRQTVPTRPPASPPPAAAAGRSSTATDTGRPRSTTPATTKRQPAKKKRTTTTPKVTPPPSPSPAPAPPPPANPSPAPAPAPDPSPADSSWEAPGKPNGALHCGARKSVGSATGSATVQQCLHVYRSGPGATYYRGLLKVTYRSDRSPARESKFFGIHRPLIDGRFSGFKACGNVTFAPGEEKWCYTGLELARGAGHRLSASGTVGNRAGGTSLEVEAPTITS